MPDTPSPVIPPVLLLGAGRMGSALFSGWVSAGLAPSVLVDPAMPAGVTRAQDVLIPSLDSLPAGFAPAAVVLAIKPQMADAVLPALGRVVPADAVLLSILAGKPISRLAALLGAEHPIVRAMPNTPAAIGRGMTVACAAPTVQPAQRALCHQLLAAVGDVAWVADEDLIDPVTSVSGSGPAYVFLLAEILEQAGIEQGIPPALARQLARKMIAGAGALLDASPEESDALRRAVTSPNGVTERALAVLMDGSAWPGSIRSALRAATERARELAG
jgi:pyrroline-5-carboxylate reductase